MSKTSNVFARVEPELKEQAERVLNQIGLPMSNAITLFLRQVVMCHGVPFPLTLPSAPPLFHVMTQNQLKIKLEEGLASMKEGKGRPAGDFFDELERKYGFENV